MHPSMPGGRTPVRVTSVACLLSFEYFPTLSVPQWQDAWAMGRCQGEEAH
jgi:hypothetical protein